MRDKTIMVRLTKDEKEALDKAAKQKHLPTAVWVRQVLLDKVKDSK